MDRDDIIRMAREAGLDLYINDVTEEPYAIRLERFAALVAEEVRGSTIESEKAGWLYAIDKAVEAEREACANVANAWQEDVFNPLYQCDCATAIRRRGEQ
jgi:hypothetical protein